MECSFLPNLLESRGLINESYYADFGTNTNDYFGLFGKLFLCPLMRKLRNATTEDRFQLSTDGLMSYIAAVDEMLGDRVDFAQLIKTYLAPREGEQRYSPAPFVAAFKVPVIGNPDPDRICTSHVERFNLTLRMGIRRMTRLTNAFSKKLENHKAVMSLSIAYYNVCKIHGSLRVTPAMEAGNSSLSKSTVASIRRGASVLRRICC